MQSSRQDACAPRRVILRSQKRIDNPVMTQPASAPFPVSENVSRMKPSSTLAAMQAAEALCLAGANVVDFGAGEPDFDTPENIKRAAAEAMRAGKTKYTPTAGIRELQQAIIDFYEQQFDTRYERTEVMATSGGKQALFNAIVSLINPGDEVLIAKPYWVTFPEIVVFAGGIPDRKSTRLNSSHGYISYAVFCLKKKKRQ